MKLEISDFPVVGGSYSAQTRLGFRPRRDLDPVRLEVPLDWAVDPFKDRNWRFQLNAWRMLPAIWSEFLKGKEGHLLDEILSWIRDWHRYHLRERRESGMTWHDMATGIRAQHLALVGFLSKRGDIGLSPADADMVESLVVEHAQQLLNEEFIARGNHAIFQLVGLRLLGEVFPDITGYAGEISYSTRLMRKLLKSQFGPLGVHVENSPSYHHFAVHQFGRINAYLFPELVNDFRSTLAAARNVEPWFAMPDGMLANIGDSEGEAKAILCSQAAADFSITTPDGTPVVAKDLSAAGYAVVRTSPDVPPERGSMLIVKSQSLSSGHAQADHLGFELFEHGARLLVDSGKYTYNIDEWRKYFRSDRAHNVVGLAGHTFDPEDSPPGSASMKPMTISSSGIFKIQARVSRGGLIDHRRTFEYLPARHLRISDEVVCGAGERAVAFLHLAPQLLSSVDPSGSSIDVHDPHGFKRMRISFTPGTFEVHLIRGQAQPTIQGWYSDSYRKKVPATVVELHAALGVTRWDIDIQVFSGADAPDYMSSAPWPIPLPDSLVDLVRVRSVRTLVNDKGQREARLLLEQSDPSVAAMRQRMKEAIIAAGYRLIDEGSRRAGLHALFVHEPCGATLRLLVRSAEAYPVKHPGMRGTSYLALAEAPCSELSKTEFP